MAAQWNESEKLELAGIILNYVRHGKTVVAAFKEFSKKSGRGYSAVSNYWHKHLASQYHDTMELAGYKASPLRGKPQKRMKEKMEFPKPTKDFKPYIESTLYKPPSKPIQAFSSPNDAIVYLSEKMALLERYEAEIKELRKQNEELSKHLDELSEMETEYKALLKMLDRARSMAFPPEPVKLKQLSDGSLERV